MPYLEYALYADTIAATLCINRERPEMDCQGKCYRNQQLADTFQQTQQQPSDAGLPASQALFQLKVAPFIAPANVSCFHQANPENQRWQHFLSDLGLSQYWEDVVSPPPQQVA